MKTSTMRIIAVILLSAACCSTQAFADLVWHANEPDQADSAPINYSDTTPQRYGYPYEIFGMSVRNYTADPGKFSFGIETNFGDVAQRTAWSSSSHNVIDLGDSYDAGPGLVNFVAGDLYILRRDLDTQAVTGVYGFVLEDRAGTGAGDPWDAGLASGGYSYAAKSAGQLYEVDLGADNGFITGTYEGYDWDHEGLQPERPGMDLARALPGLIDNGNTYLTETPWYTDSDNSYPVILADGTLVNTSDAPTWTTMRGWDDGLTPDLAHRGAWAGEFVLPNFDANNEYIDVWWSMQCGNDAARISQLDPGSDPVPAPGALLLCGIGIGFIAVVKRFRK